MSEFRARYTKKFIYKKRFWISFCFLIFFILIRISKGSLILDLYSQIITPIFSETISEEISDNRKIIDQDIKIKLLQKDNNRLRNILSLNSFNSSDKINAIVISRKLGGWWHQFDISQGKNKGIRVGDSVVSENGLVGLINSVTPTTSRVKLLTSPSSKIGVWLPRLEHHGILLGMGTNKVKLKFFNKNSSAKKGDIVSTSPASTLVAPNIPVGIIYEIKDNKSASPFAIVDLKAKLEAIDWVQVYLNNEN